MLQKVGVGLHIAHACGNTPDHQQVEVFGQDPQPSPLDKLKIKSFWSKATYSSVIHYIISVE